MRLREFVKRLALEACELRARLTADGMPRSEAYARALAVVIAELRSALDGGPHDD